MTEQRRPPFVWLLALTAAGLTAVATAHRAVEAPATSPPSGPLVLWAWERPEDLRFLAAAPGRGPVAVALLVGTLELRGDGARWHGRRQPLALPSTAEQVAVVRIEVAAGVAPSLSPGQRRQAVTAILAASRDHHVLQIDFDARRSERAFYTALLHDLRRERPAPSRLAITALASWCLGDPWLAELPIDEAVPMLFRLGSGEVAVRRELSRGTDFRSPLCRQSYGLATDETPPRLRPGRRRWWFSPRPWTAERFAALPDPDLRESS